MSTAEQTTGPIAIDGDYGEPIYVKGRRHLDLIVTLAGGVGVAEYKLQASFEKYVDDVAAGDLFDLSEDGIVNVSQLTAGSYVHRVDSGDAFWLLLTAVDVQDNGYTLSGVPRLFNMESGY